MKISHKKVLLDVAYPHFLKGVNYVLHPYKNEIGDGKGMYSVIKQGTTTPNEYLTEDELAELFAIDGFLSLGIRVRMWTENGEYGSSSPPAMMLDAGKHLTPNSIFQNLVALKYRNISSNGLSAPLIEKLKKIDISVGKAFIGTSSEPTHVKLNNSEASIESEIDIDLNVSIDIAEKTGSTEESIQLRSIKTRRGQPKFRASLLVAYDGRCAVTDCNVDAVLEAAHIIPHAEDTDWDVSNGLLLRADIHTLFDLYRLSVNPSGYRIQLSPELKGTEYEEYEGVTLRLSSQPSEHPSQAKLDKHFKEFLRRQS